MTVRARASWRAARRSSRLWKRMVCVPGAAAATGGGVCVIEYGSGRAWIAPGVSTVVESASVQPSGRQPRGTMNELPRRSRMDLMFSPLARRCASSTSARSALPNSNRSAFASGRIERFIVSDQ